MSEIVFNHDGWTVVTSAWTAASKRPDKVIVCYPWSGMSGMSMWGDAATGVARIEFDMTMADFLARTQLGRRADFRPHQGASS